MMENAAAAAVSVKAPPFIPSNPATWFVILEAQFNIAGIVTSSTKFYHALANLPVETVTNLDDTILQASDYDELKQAVKRFHEKSRGELFDNFLQETPLTGKPSHFLLQMAKIAKKVGVGDDMVRHRFQQALPASIAPVIASQRTLGLEDLGRLADELLPLLKTTELTSSVTFERQARTDTPHLQRCDVSSRLYSYGLLKDINADYCCADS